MSAFAKIADIRCNVHFLSGGACVAWAEAVTRNTAKSDKALWDTMKRLFSEAEIVEITLAAAMFNMAYR
jgi:alkylhydroperoxidase family enzyme